MALLSDYTAGTVTVAAGGTAVTGVGTGWQTAGFQEGDEFFASGWHGIVQSINSNTSLTLYPTGIRGAALAGSAYRLRYQGDGSRLTAQARQLIDLLGGSGNFAALAGLDGAANTFPIFTGAGTMDVATVTAFFRGLMDATDGPNLYGQMGEIPNPQLPLRLGVTGDAPTDLNAIADTGFYLCNLTAANAPIPGARALVLHQRYSSTVMLQTAYVWGTTARVYHRTFNTDTWNSWTITALPLIGTVSQSGGVPSGSLFERGSNANGDYVRLADGTQICAMIRSLGPSDIPSGGSYTFAASYPAAFAAAPFMASTFGGINLAGAGAYTQMTKSAITARAQNSSGFQFMLTMATTPSHSFDLQALAFGRWF